MSWRVCLWPIGSSEKLGDMAVIKILTSCGVSDDVAKIATCLLTRLMELLQSHGSTETTMVGKAVGEAAAMGELGTMYPI